MNVLIKFETSRKRKVTRNTTRARNLSATSEYLIPRRNPDSLAILANKHTLANKVYCHLTARFSKEHVALLTDYTSERMFEYNYLILPLVKERIKSSEVAFSYMR